jgi:hypothetical protein
MRVRDEIRVSRPVNGGMDVPLVFECDFGEQVKIAKYIERYFPGDQYPGPLIQAAVRLVERGIPQGITKLVMDELSRRGRGAEVESVEPFVVVGVK